MANRNNISRALSVFIGKVNYGKYQSGAPGVEMSPLYKFRSAPALGVSTDVAASQAVVSTTFVINGARASGGVATFDVPRNVIAAWTNTAILTITGTDQYGITITEVTASGTSHTGKKAFKTITSVSSNASITGATVGSGNVLGLPFRVDASDLIAARFNNAIDAGTFVPADTTSPVTSSTGDQRGTFALAGTLDGAKVLTLLLSVSDRSTQSGSFGVGS